MHTSSWVLSPKTGGTSSYFGDGVSTDISISIISNAYDVDSNWTVRYSGIPYYNRVLNSADITALTTRPKKATDFTTGSTTASLFDLVIFGEDLGYSGSNCSLGYWPPTVQCPLPASSSWAFQLRPVYILSAFQPSLWVHNP